MRIAIDWKKRGREALLLAGISLFLAFVRPYGSNSNAPFLLNFGIWLLLIFSGSIVGELTVAAYYRLRPNGPAWLMIMITSLVTAAGVTFVIYALTFLTGGYIRVGDGPIHIIYFYVLVIAVAMTLTGYTVSRAFAAAGPDFATAADEKDSVSKFLHRLPVRFHSADLWAVTSEDHYCRVYTSLGSDLILIRISDVDRELADADGLRVHRSWWVARKGVARADRSDGRLKLVLHSGEEVPVSRSYQAAVKDAGFAS